MKFLKKLRLAYGDMKLSSKFTLVLMITATIPVIMMAGFFYGRLYDMVVSYTIRQEQDTSAQTAPYVEELVQKVIDAHDGIAEQKFFQTLFHQPVNSPFQMFLETDSAKDFQEYAKDLVSSDLITGIQIYMDDIWTISAPATPICPACWTIPSPLLNWTGAWCFTYWKTTGRS